MPSGGQLLAVISVLAFLATVLIALLSTVLFAAGLIFKSRFVAWSAATALGSVLSCYFLVLLGFSLFSREETLPVGVEKYFCEIDCHIANSVAGTRWVSAPGPELQTAAGHDYAIVAMNTRFDPKTISPQRGDGPLTPNERLVALVDEKGARYAPASNAAEILGKLGVATRPLRTALRPGESYTTYLVFEVPSTAKGFRLDFRSGDAEDRFLWGNESSLLHKKVYFSVGERRLGAGLF